MLLLLLLYCQVHYSTTGDGKSVPTYKAIGPMKYSGKIAQAARYATLVAGMSLRAPMQICIFKLWTTESDCIANLPLARALRRRVFLDACDFFHHLHMPDVLVCYIN